MPVWKHMKDSLFITDFDGTLLTDEKTIAQQDLLTLSRLKKRNIITAIATGRSLYSLERALNLIVGEDKLPVDYLIFSTGAGIMDAFGGGIIQSHAISTKDIRKIIACFDASKLDYMVHKAIPDTPYFLYKSHGGKNLDFQARIRLYKEFSTPLGKGQALYDSATQVLGILPGGISSQRMVKIRKDLFDYSVIHATSPLDHSSAWIEVFNKQVSKSLAASWLASKLGIARRDVVCVGNDYNDQDLLEWSGRGYLTANGPCDLKRRFKTVSSNNHCGVSQAVRKSGLLAR
jgi:Cof subfamily protein (haloacid dehalogenase superfamily)